MCARWRMCVYARWRMCVYARRRTYVCARWRMCVCARRRTCVCARRRMCVCARGYAHGVGVCVRLPGVRIHGRRRLSGGCGCWRTMCTGFIGVGADTQVCPYRYYRYRPDCLDRLDRLDRLDGFGSITIGFNHDDPMEMVGHYDVFIRLHVRKFAIQFYPPMFDHSPRVVQTHFPVHDIAEQTRPILGHDGNKIRPRTGIIVSFQANAAAMVFLSHSSSPLFYNNPFSFFTPPEGW
ncbi:MAG: hypothetical protein ONB24_08290 [candidate division KSB1 bacterium]|nr:hypothetical protein [candidate division KSB1 bacterium]